MTLPLEVVAPVVGALAVAVVTLWRWGVRLYRESKEQAKEIKALNEKLLAEKEEKVRILTGLKEEAERKKRAGDSGEHGKRRDHGPAV